MSRHCTICDLPTELLDMIVSTVRYMDEYVWPDSWYGCMSQITLVCRCLRAVAVEYLFDRHRHPGLHLSPDNLTSFNHPIQFLRTHPRAAKKIMSISILGSSEMDWQADAAHRLTIDDSIVASLMALLPNVKYVEFESLRYGPPTEIALSKHPGPFSLHRLRFHERRPGSHNQLSSMAGLFSILSLFSTEELYQSPYMIPKLDASVPSAFRRPLTVERLITTGDCGIRQPGCTHGWLKRLTEIIALDCLTELSVKYETPQEIIEIGTLLARAGANVRSLNLQCDVPRANFSHDDRRTWVDPLQYTWRQLKISTCAHLESIQLPITLGDHLSVKPLLDDHHDCTPVTTSLDAAVGILSQAALTLRRIIIFLHGFSTRQSELDKQLEELRELDKVVTQGFPALEEFDLRLSVTMEYQCEEDYWAYLRAELRLRALAQMHARGQLRITEWCTF